MILLHLDLNEESKITKLLMLRQHYSHNQEVQQRIHVYFTQFDRVKKVNVKFQIYMVKLD